MEGFDTYTVQYWGSALLRSYGHGLYYFRNGKANVAWYGGGKEDTQG